jgi:hypothetical protein
MRKAVRLIAFRKGRYNNALDLGIPPIAKVVLRYTPRSVCGARDFILSNGSLMDLHHSK